MKQLSHFIRTSFSTLVRKWFRFHYPLHTQGLHHIPKNGGVLLLGNHVSHIDWILLQQACPRPLQFVMEKNEYQHPTTKKLLKHFAIQPIRNIHSPESQQAITERLQAGEVVCVFPEGRISRTGQLGELDSAFSELAQAVPDTTIIPFHLHNLWGSHYSHASSMLKKNRRTGLKRPVMLSFGESMPTDSPAAQVKQQIFEQSVRNWNHPSLPLQAVSVSWLRNAKSNLFKLISADIQGNALNHQRFLTAVLSFRPLIAKLNPAQNVGMLLPTSTGGAIANMAVFSLGKTAINLNYTASKEALQSAAQQTELRCLFTSRRFVDKLKERNIDIADTFSGLELIYLEDLKEAIPKSQMLINLLQVTLLPSRLLQHWYIKPVDMEGTAAILFSSGSEGAPKGIELSHRNLACNARQVADALNPTQQDVIMATLPTFHAFGLLASTLMPLTESISIVCHPDPTDGQTIAQGIAKYQATLLFGTSTFLRLYARHRHIHPIMLDSLRLVVAGAEKLTPEVRKLFQERFSKIIYEGYGATETSPVASVNLPDTLHHEDWQVQSSHHLGSVGLPLTGTSFRVVDPDNLESLPQGKDGLILIGGPQVMKGYLHNAEKTADSIVELDGIRWYKSGDKGHIDELGFLTIVDRYSRFAKLGGEMVSLSAVEAAVRDAMGEPELEVVSVNLPDDKKGEQIILLMTGDYDPKTVRSCMVEARANPLMIPSKVFTVDEVPKLGSGKTDFSASRKLAESCLK